MSRLFLKLLIYLTGLGLLVFWFSKSIKVWELEVIEPQPLEPADPPKPVTAQKKSIPPAAGDDLTKIKGIGPVYEKKLKDLGLSTYQQIASLSSRDVERIEDQLSGFSGRIEREHWIEQAKTLSENPDQA